ncbi:rhomboid-like protein [Streptomyces sp. NPDC101152]|uniref:rhomboid-like protein n=1 Tax=Streptomyces sp. NPDC101152 TaxID=3366116 RepID=UPI00381C2F5A
MEQTATADTKSSVAPLPEVFDLLDGMPRQRGSATACAAAVPAAVPAPGIRFPRVWRLLPTPTGTPFTFGYAALLAVTSLFATYASSPLVNALYQASSTDVAHLVREPGEVLVASALWVAGGFTSPYVACFLLVLTALERRVGGARTAVVFVFGHVLATLATEGTVGVSVLVGDLPGTSLHRLDFGISFGVATSLGALAGLLPPWLRWPMLTLFAAMLIDDLSTFTDPMTDWGHLISLAIGVSTWPLLRRWQRTRRAVA